MFVFYAEFFQPINCYPNKISNQLDCKGTFAFAAERLHAQLYHMVCFCWV